MKRQALLGAWGQPPKDETPGQSCTGTNLAGCVELDTSGDEASVLDEEGRVAARVGEKVYMGGGGICEDQVTLADERMLRELFECWPGEY